LDPTAVCPPTLLTSQPHLLIFNAPNHPCVAAGPNGCGKSTLLRLVMGQEEPITGRVQLGPHNIVPAYFAQNQADALDLKQNVLQTMVKAAPDAQLNDVKALLGRMMFNGKAMEKKVGACLCVCPYICVCLSAVCLSLSISVCPARLEANESLPVSVCLCHCLSVAQ